MKTDGNSQGSTYDSEKVTQRTTEEKKTVLLDLVEKSLTYLLLLKNNSTDWNSLQTILQNVQKIKIGAWDLSNKRLDIYAGEFEVFLGALSRSRVSVDIGALQHIRDTLEDIKKLI